MQVLLYEFVTGGGLWRLGEDPQRSPLLAEGNAMLAALATDLCELPRVSPIVVWDRRLGPFDVKGCHVVEVAASGEDLRAIAELAKSADAVLLIAPEFDGQLTRLSRTVELAGGRLFSPHADFIELASDKWRTNRRLGSRGVKVPNSLALPAEAGLPERFTYPAVLKPRAGAGSLGVQLVTEATAPQLGKHERWCLEEFCPGTAASVSVLCGPAGSLLLPPCRQLQPTDGRFEYLGGSYPLPGQLHERARRLAGQAVAALPATTGYIGLDIVLGPPEDGSRDVVIEVNPRLTTSYLLLRQAAKSNIAAALLATAQGQPYELSFTQDPLEFFLHSL